MCKYYFFPKFTIYLNNICYRRQSQSYKCRKVPNCNIILIIKLRIIKFFINLIIFCIIKNIHCLTKVHLISNTHIYYNEYSYV